ncbi:hypothetical protein ACP4OV_007926 [Aristida adscensionis]
MPHVKAAPGGKRNWSSGGMASGRKSSRREDAKENSTRVAAWSKRGSGEEQKGRQGNAGPRRNRSEGAPAGAVKNNVSGIGRRKRKIDDDEWDDGGGYKTVSSSKPKLTRKSTSTITRRRISPGNGGRLKSQSLYEDDLRSEKRSTNKFSDISRGAKDRSVFGKNAAVSKGKKFDESTEVRRKRGGSKEVDLEQEVADNKKSDESSHITEEEKPRPRLTRVLDRTGKKIKPAKKDVVPDSEEPTPPKKRKRMKLDPYDTSNKRIDDSPPKQDVANTEKILEKCAPEETDEMSINAKFRAIQPSSSILSYVEDNLLGRRRLNEIKNAGYNVRISAPLDNVPFSTRTERERIEESVFRNKLEFYAAAKISSSFPPPTMPEIAFAGVSNVGKSSLLNALTRQWGIVRTSDKPGLTQTINFFRLASKLNLVDLPGYGFAYAKDEVKESWQELVKEYVSTRVGLERVCLLVHTKRGMKPLDYELVDLMERHKTPYQIVLTKTDLVFPIDVARRAMEIQQSLKKNKSVVNPVMMVSSKTGAGIRNLRGVLGKLARFIKP